MSTASYLYAKGRNYFGVIAKISSGLEGADERMIAGMIFDVGFSRPVVPLASENTLASGALESQANSANPREEVDESEPTGHWAGLRVRKAQDFLES